MTNKTNKNEESVITISIPSWIFSIKNFLISNIDNFKYWNWTFDELYYYYVYFAKILAPFIYIYITILCSYNFNKGLLNIDLIDRIIFVPIFSIFIACFVGTFFLVTYPLFLPISLIMFLFY